MVNQPYEFIPTELDKCYNQIEHELFMVSERFEDLVKFLCKISKQHPIIDLSEEFMIIIENTQSVFTDIFDKHNKELHTQCESDNIYHEFCEYIDIWITEMCNFKIYIKKFGIIPVPNYPQPKPVFMSISNPFAEAFARE